jgi:phosphoribosyl-ATP pyrophosphohydrolase/phosphoribosyl-AMP cyclohydrolase
MSSWKESIGYDEQGLVPAVVQDACTGDVLMLAYMNRESLEKTLESGEAWFFSRSRQSLWHKGETSGHTLVVREIRYDCDGDALLLLVDPAGPACHTGAGSCFYRSGWHSQHQQKRERQPFIGLLDQIIAQRQTVPAADSYTARLLASGRDRILRKIGEESGELIIAAKNADPIELLAEMADLWYHCLVLLHSEGLDFSAVDQVLASRHSEGGAK